MYSTPRRHIRHKAGEERLPSIHTTAHLGREQDSVHHIHTRRASLHFPFWVKSGAVGRRQLCQTYEPSWKVWTTSIRSHFNQPINKLNTAVILMMNVICAFGGLQCPLTRWSRRKAASSYQACQTPSRSETNRTGSGEVKIIARHVAYFDAGVRELLVGGRHMAQTLQ